MKGKSIISFVLMSLLVADVIASPVEPSEVPGASFKSSGDVRVMVQSVSENRSTETGGFSSDLKIKLSVMGDYVQDAKATKVTINSAVDDIGRSLIPNNDSSHMISQDEFDKINSIGSMAASAEIKLQPSTRNAKFIKNISGQVELYLPSLDPNSVITISNLSQDGGKLLNSTTLKNEGIELIVFNKNQLELWQKEQAKQTPTPAKANAGALDQMGEGLANAFKSAFGAGMPVMDDKKILVYAKKGANKVVGVEFSDSAGKPLKRGYSSRGGEWQTYSFEEPVPIDTKVTINVVTPKAIKKSAFELTNVPLP